MEDSLSGGGIRLIFKVCLQQFRTVSGPTETQLCKAPFQKNYLPGWCLRLWLSSFILQAWDITDRDYNAHWLINILLIINQITNKQTAVSNLHYLACYYTQLRSYCLSLLNPINYTQLLQKYKSVMLLSPHHLTWRCELSLLLYPPTPGHSKADPMGSPASCPKDSLWHPGGLD